MGRWLRPRVDARSAERDYDQAKGAGGGGQGHSPAGPHHVDPIGWAVRDWAAPWHPRTQGRPQGADPLGAAPALYRGAILPLQVSRRLEDRKSVVSGTSV